MGGMSLRRPRLRGKFGTLMAGMARAAIDPLRTSSLSYTPSGGKTLRGHGCGAAPHMRVFTGRRGSIAVDPFEFLFSLFGLLLGLSLAEVLHGFSKAVKARARVRIGWLTPLLGMLVMLDVISFWVTAWFMREMLTITYLTFLGMLLFAGAYYLAATLVFPEQPVPGTDYDEHYWANKKLVTGAVFALNLPFLLYELVTTYPLSITNPRTLIIATIFYGLVGAIFLARSHRLTLVLLVAAVAQYPLLAIAGPWIWGDWIG